MQVLVLRLGGVHYALKTREVVRVLPAMRLTPMPRSPAFVAGIMNLHGTPVPVLDLARITSTAGIESDLQPASEVAPATVDSGTSFDTRIILVELARSGDARHLLGLRAEHLTGIRSIDAADVASSGLHDPHSRFLGQVVGNQEPLLQLITLQDLLPAHVSAWLFEAVPEAAC
jgi:chemotaxis-related protein WspB